MKLTIGRVGLDVELSYPRDVGHSLSRDGAEQVSISGNIKNTTTLAEANALRTELLAQVGQIVPVTLTIDTPLDGYYELVSANVDVRQSLGSLQSTGFFAFSVQLEKKLGAAFEVAFSGGLMPNTHTITAAANKGLVGLGVGADLRWTQDPSGSVAVTDLESEDGAIRCFYQLDSGDYGLRFSIDPADFYGGACELWVDGRLRAGSGRLFTAPTTVLLTNGQIELTFALAVNGDVSIRHYADSAWETAKRYHFQTTEGNANGNWTEARIIRNGPECVTIQLTRPRETNGQGFQVLNVTIRRGWRVALIQFKCDVADALGIERQAAEAASALGSNAGIIATAADAAGNKYIIFCPETHTVTNAATTAGVKLTVAAKTVTLGVGSVINSASADTGADTADLTDQFYNFLNARQHVIVGEL